MSPISDVLILGAGAAGLAAARKLSVAGFSVVVLEAQRRIGGRILTEHGPENAPNELGAEFLHGQHPAILEIARRANLALLEVPNRHWYLRNGQLDTSSKFWSQIEKVMKEISAVKDEKSFHDYLAIHEKDDQARTIASLYVEGFHAAQTNRISILGLNKVNHAAEEIEGDKQFRFASGYDSLIAVLHSEAVSNGAEFHLETVARNVKWKRNAVEVEAISSRAGMVSFKARSLIVTLPLGVLQAQPNEIGALCFEPDLTSQLGAARKLAVGHVVKIVLRFREPFWETLTLGNGSTPTCLKDLMFLQAPEERIPTWWTQLPIRRSLLVGWAGGPRAEELSTQSDDVVVDQSMESLSHVLRIPRTHIETLLETALVHNWRTDPFARGAYSYVPVGGLTAQDQLAQPVENTIYFAGEAINTEGHAGTVHGAITSGTSVARKIIQQGAAEQAEVSAKNALH